MPPQPPRSAIVIQTDTRKPTILRLGLLLLLFDVYLTWARVEKAMPSSPSLPLSPPPPLPPFPASISNLTNSTASTLDLSNSSTSVAHSSNFLNSQPILLQYLFFLALCTLETVSFHLSIRSLLSVRLPRPLSAIIPHYPQKALVSTALLVSSFTKLFPLLLLIWNYDLPSSASAISWAVIINNVAALEILLDCGYARAAVLAAIGAVCRAAVGWVSRASTTNSHRQLIISQGHSEGRRRRRWCCGRWHRGDGRRHRNLEALRRECGSRVDTDHSTMSSFVTSSIYSPVPWFKNLATRVLPPTFFSDANPPHPTCCSSTDLVDTCTSLKIPKPPDASDSV